MKKLIAFLVAIVATFGLSIGAAAPASAATDDFTVDGNGITLIEGYTWADTESVTIYGTNYSSQPYTRQFDFKNTDSQYRFMGWWEFLQDSYITVDQVDIDFGNRIESWNGSVFVRSPYLTDFPLWNVIDTTQENRCINGYVYFYFKVVNSSSDRTFTSSGNPSGIVTVEPGKTKSWSYKLRPAITSSPHTDGAFVIGTIFEGKPVEMWFYETFDTIDCN